jgi:hypothetical protein
MLLSFALASAEDLYICDAISICGGNGISVELICRKDLVVVQAPITTLPYSSCTTKARHQV